MKKLTLFIFALLLINPVIISQWQTFNVSTSGRFYDVCVVNPNLIWVCGDSAKVYRSTNSGTSWQIVNNGLPNVLFVNIHAIDGNFAWLNTGFRIFATTNGGINWNEQFYTPLSFINTIHFFNSSTGYILADQTDSIIGFMITRNGGLNWTRSVNAPVLGAISTMWVNDNGANSLDSNFIWFVAKGSPQVFSRFYKLAGGLNNSWQYYNIGTSTSQCSYAAFKNSGTGLATSITYGILNTTNGGINWEVRNNSAFTDVSRELMIVPGTDWVIQTGIRNVRISYDLCSTWQPINSYNFLSFCDSRDTNSIWLAGSNGQLLKYNFAYIGINQISTEIPEKFILYQNYPNPFNPVTKIKFDVPNSGNISFKVYDVLGKVVQSINEYKDAGTYEITFNGNSISSGVYYYSIEANGLSDVKKMVLLK